MKRCLWLTLLAVCAGYPCLAEEFSSTLVSVAYVGEEGESGEHLSGLKVGWLVYLDDHAPPIAGGVSLEYLEGDTGKLSRLGGSFSPLAFPFGRASLWLRPQLGLEYRRFDGEDELSGFGAAGVEFIFRTTPSTQIAATYDRVFSFSGGTANQIGLAFRLGVGIP